MHYSSTEHFRRMDQYAADGIPFLFLINFCGNNVKVFTLEELNKSKILVNFPEFKKYPDEKLPEKALFWQAFPETMKSYAEGFDYVQKNLKFGNSYLTNYTCKTEIQTNYSLQEIFLRSKAKYKLCFSEEFVFFSPETFIEIKNSRISTHPMKGTIDASVPNAENLLKNSVKEKAEHYTVVDLLRNDLSLVADDVTVEEFQRIDLIRTQQKDLLAMSSEISGEIKPEYKGKIGTVLQKLIPAGSILGAPKPKTLEIILNSEKHERGFYTGICGWFDGENLDSCVMIRFIEKEGEKLYFRSGGGITHLSNLEDEYQEMKNKIYVPFY